jgi:NAD+ synthase (glutamine-hydrolysing)
VTFAEIDITETAKLVLSEMDHPFARGEKVYDVTFENVQAGLRTDYLFRLANQRGGIVLGTGDLSELALGWSTYGVGDQMSHYNVNGGVPKTLIQHLIRWVISSAQFDETVNDVLASVLATEISPELVPTGEDEEIQSSEGKVDPMSCRTSHCSTYCGSGYGHRRSRFWHGTPGMTPSAATGQAAIQWTSGRRIR